jgi:hypothetical protein
MACCSSIAEAEPAHRRIFRDSAKCRGGDDHGHVGEGQKPATEEFSPTFPCGSLREETDLFMFRGPKIVGYASGCPGTGFAGAVCECASDVVFFDDA